MGERRRNVITQAPDLGLCVLSRHHADTGHPTHMSSSRTRGSKQIPNGGSPPPPDNFETTPVVTLPPYVYNPDEPELVG